MRRRGATARRALAALPLLLLGAGAGAAAADDAAEVFRLGPLQIVDPWAKSAIGVHEAQLFFQFRNGGQEPDALVGARSPVATGPTRLRVVHSGPAGRRLEDLKRIPIPAGDGEFELSEVGYFVELTELQVPLVMGSEFTVTLEFERAGSISVPFTNRFHSPKLARRIGAALERGDFEALRALRRAP